MILLEAWETAPAPAGRRCGVIRRSSHFELWVELEGEPDVLGAENPSAEGTDAFELERLAFERGATAVVHWWFRAESLGIKGPSSS